MSTRSQTERALLCEVKSIGAAVQRGLLSYEQAVERFVFAVVASRLSLPQARAAVKPVSRYFAADRDLDRRFCKLLTAARADRTIH